MTQKPTPLPSQDWLLSRYRYDAETGELYLRPRSLETFTKIYHKSAQQACDFWNKHYANIKIGFLDKEGYVKIRVQKKLVGAHRVIWKMLHGNDPNQIDHIDGVKSNNKDNNLRDCTLADNNRNRASVRNGKNKLGAYRRPNDAGWYSKIQVDKKAIYLGSFATEAEAVAAYQLALPTPEGET